MQISGSGFPAMVNRSMPTLGVQNAVCPVQCSPPLAPSDGMSHASAHSTSSNGQNDRSLGKIVQCPVSSKVDMQLIMTCPHSKNRLICIIVINWIILCSGVAMELSPSTLKGVQRKGPTSNSTPWKSPLCSSSRGFKVGALPDITVGHHNDVGPSPLDGSTAQLLESKSADPATAVGDMTSVCCPGFGSRRNVSTKNPASPICLLLWGRIFIEKNFFSARNLKQKQKGRISWLRLFRPIFSVFI